MYSIFNVQVTLQKSYLQVIIKKKRVLKWANFILRNGCCINKIYGINNNIVE